MINKWVARWKDETGAHKKAFESDPPTPAVTFAKEIRSRGLSVEVYSARRAFAPPPKARYPDRPGVLWCPYCVKWREFQEAALKDGDGLLGPTLLRCMICTVSIRDAYIRKYNSVFYAKYEVQQEMKKTALKNKKEAKQLSSAHRYRRRN